MAKKVSPRRKKSVLNFKQWLGMTVALSALLAAVPSPSTQALTLTVVNGVAGLAATL